MVAPRTVLIALLVLALAPLPQGSAQDPAPEPTGTPIRLMEDPGDDLQTDADTPGPVPRGSMDLRFLDITEGLEDLTFTVGTSPYTGAEDQGVIEIHFAHGDASYRLHMEQRSIAGWWWMFQLYRAEPQGESFVAIGEDLASDGQAGTVTFVLAKKDLADRAGVIPFVGRQLTGFWAETKSLDNSLPLHDRMPDTGEGSTFTIAIGEVQAGDVELWSSSPTRASNGEATTVVYIVSAHNKGASQGRFVFDAQDVPKGWNVVFPQPAPLLDAGQTADFPVLVGLPFIHQHGKVEALRVTLTGIDDDADRGSVRLSVNYHKVPQPAGHHPEVFLHSYSLGDLNTPVIQQSGVAVWDRVTMNTLDEFDADQELSVPGLDDGPGRWTWESPLDPVLQMGLDFDLERQGAVNFPFTSRLGITGAKVGGTLDVDWQDPDTGEFQTLTVADVVPDAPVDLARDVQTVLKGAIVARPEGDLVAYREGANLVLRLAVEGTPAVARPAPVMSDVMGDTGPEKPWLNPGGFFSLPLFEYSDPVDGLFSSFNGVEVRVADPAQRQANPGESVRFPLHLAFKDRAEFVVAFAGQDAALAQVVDGSRIKAGPEGVDVEIAVTLPADAVDGQVFDVLVIAQKADDDAVQGIVRIVPEADTEADHPDEAVVGEGKADAPAGSVLLALAAVASALASRRRA